MSDKQEDELQKLRKFLIKIQLGNFFEKLIDNLHILKIDHFEYVAVEDLVGIGMSLPDIRRLLDQVKTGRKNSLKAVFRVKKALGLSNQNLKEINTESVKGMRGKAEMTDSSKCIINEQDIIVNESLGKGAFGVVHKAEWKVGKQKRDVAVKSLQVGSEHDLQQLIHDLMMEAKTMLTLRHPNLIELYGITVTPPMMLVTELAPLGSLLTRLRKEPDKFLISTLSSFLVQIVAGMKYLEEQNFVHRDLAARNCLLMTYEKVKIGDFGLSRHLRIDEDFYVMQPQAKLPTAWCAPECLEFKKFSHASDIWAFGVTAFEILSLGAQPWPTLTANEIFERISEPNNERLPRPQNCPKILYDVMKNTCWANNPEERGSFKILERHIIDCLPHELKATFSNNHGEPNDDLQFIEGDLITAFDFSNGISWKCQNRRTQQIGFIPKDHIHLKSGKIEKTKDESRIRRRYASEGDIHMKNQSSLDVAIPSERKSFDAKVDRRYFGVRRLSRPIEQDSSGSGYESNDSSSILDKRKDSASYNFSISSSDSGCRCSSQYSGDSIYAEIDTPSSQPVNIPGRCQKYDRSSTSASPFSNFSFDASSPASSPNGSLTSQIYSSPSSVSRSPLSASSNQWQFHKVIEESDGGGVYVDMNELKTKKSPLPDIVNPNKKTSTFSRRRSLPRLKNKLVSKFEEKRFSVRSPQSTPPMNLILSTTHENCNNSKRPNSVPVFPLSLYEKPSSSQWYDEVPKRIDDVKIIEDNDIYENIDLVLANSSSKAVTDIETKIYLNESTQENIAETKNCNSNKNALNSDVNCEQKENTKNNSFVFVNETELPSPRYENVIREGSLFEEITAELTLSDMSTMLGNTSIENDKNLKEVDSKREDEQEDGVATL